MKNKRSPLRPDYPSPNYPTRSSAWAFLLLPLAFLFVNSGCERRLIQPDFFPMRDGNRWAYRLLDHKALTALKAGAEIELKPDPLDDEGGRKEEGGEGLADVIETEEAGGEKGPSAAQVTPKKIAVRQVTLVLKEPVDELTYRASYDHFEQVWSKAGGYLGFQNARARYYLLILPPHSGYRWVVTDSQGKDVYYEVEGFGEVRTPAGNFRNCAIARQESRDRRTVFRYWFAPEAGLVRRSKFFAGEEVFRQELLSFQVRPSTEMGRKAEAEAVGAACRGKDRGREHQRKGRGPDPPGPFPVYEE